MKRFAFFLFCSHMAWAQQPQLLKDISPGNKDGARLASAAVLNNRLYFGAGESLTNHEVWSTDGTASGTLKLAEINPNGGSNPNSFFTWNGKVYFSASPSELEGGELHVTDGTPQGTYLLKDLYEGSGGSDPKNFYVYNGKMYFEAAFHSEDPATKIIRSDGTAAGTGPVPFPDTLIGIYQTGAHFSCPALPFKDHVIIGDAFLGAIGLVNLTTLQPTVLRNDQRYYGLKDFTELYKDSLFVFATDTMGAVFNIWLSDGTPSGTRTIFRSECAQRTPLLRLGEAAYFIQYGSGNPAGHGLWRVGADGVTQVKQTGNIDHTPAITSFNGSLYFVAESTGGKTMLWKSDSTNAEAVHEFDAYTAGSPGVILGNSVAYGSRLYFPGYSAASGWELWSMDESGGDIKMVYDLNPGTAHGVDPWNISFAKLGAQLLFEGNNGSTGTEIFTIGSLSGADEQTAGTSAVSVYPNPAENIVHILSRREVQWVRISDPTGKLLYERASVSDRDQLNISHISPGVYFLEVFFADGSSSVQKLIRH